MSRPARTRTPLRRRLLLLACATLVSLALAEVAVRVWGAVNGANGPGEYLAYDRELGWRNRPGFDGRHITAEFDVAVRFDEQGRRCGVAGLTETADATAPLVFAIGDSTTFGWGVEHEQTFASLLASRLPARIDNFGVSGYGSDQQLLLLRRELADRRPRLVIVSHTPNDLREVQFAYLYRMYKPRFEVVGDGLRLTGVPTPRDWLAEASHLWRAALKRLGRFEIEELSPAATRSGQDLAARIYREMHRECRSRGIGLMITARDSDWLRDACRAESIPFVDLTATFARMQASGPIRFELDGHWLPRLHVAIAEQLAAFIAERRLLSGG